MDDGRWLTAARHPGVGPVPSGPVTADRPPVPSPGGGWSAGTSGSGRQQGRPAHARPTFAVPGLVLLAALAIHEGYTELRIMSDGWHRISGTAFALLAVPAAYALTRGLTTGTAARLRAPVMICAAAVPVLAAAGLTGHGAGWGRILGVVSLVLAVLVLVLAVVAERDRRASSPY